MVQELTNETFTQEVKNFTGLALVDFWAPWCGPCRMMAPIVEEVSNKVTEIKFAKLNTDDYQDLAVEYRITGIPCLVLFQNGQEIDRFVGAQPADALEKKLRTHL